MSLTSPSSWADGKAPGSFAAVVTFCAGKENTGNQGLATYGEVQTGDYIETHNNTTHNNIHVKSWNCIYATSFDREEVTHIRGLYEASGEIRVAQAEGSEMPFRG